MTETTAPTTAPTIPASTPTGPVRLASSQGDLNTGRLAVAGTAYTSYTAPANPGPNPDAQHPWERAGLGVAPYQLVGVAEVTYQACPGAPVQAGTSCDYCGQGIRRAYSIRAACGSMFKVGCECVRRATDSAEEVRRAVESADRKHRNALARAAARRRDDQVKAELAAIRAEHADRLAALPHPSRWEGKSALDWLDHMLRVCGATGRARVLRQARALVAGAATE